MNMRSTTERLPLLTAGLALPALLALMTSCGGASPNPKAGPCVSEEYASRPSETVSVVVTFDREAKKAVASPDWVILRGGKDSMQWISPDGDVEVDFDKESPFPEPPALDPKDKILKSKPALPVTARKSFKYKVSLKLTTDPDHPKKVDPRVEIWP
jgi:hypothetical protein